jgi:hypothetical protein
MTHRHRPRLVQFSRGKPLFTGRKIEEMERGPAGMLAFTPACCCNQECFRTVIFVSIGVAGNTDGPIEPPDSPPIRKGAKVLFHYHIYDTVPLNYEIGRNYHTEVWAIEYCWTQWDLNPADLLSPEESYYEELLDWACLTEKLWYYGASDEEELNSFFAPGGKYFGAAMPTCSPIIEHLDDPWCEATYQDIINEHQSGYNELTDCQWTDELLYGGEQRYLDGGCPHCTCHLSCSDPCPDITYRGTEKCSTIYLIEISANGISGAGPTEPADDDPTGYNGKFGTATLVWHAHAYDQYPGTNIGNYYHTHFWAVEICYECADQFCAETSFEEYLNNWACNLQKSWTGSTTCTYNIEIIPDYQRNPSYLRGILDDEVDAITQITSPPPDTNQAIGQDLYGPNFETDCISDQNTDGSAFIRGG